MDWDKLRVFHAVAEAGSFTHAGEKLELSQSATSRQISALEESLGVPLFHRHARGLILTEQGEVLHNAARDIFAKLASVEIALTETREKPSGPLKITTTFAFGSTWLAPRLPAFVAKYPEIKPALLIDDRELDLAMRAADVAIRMVPPRHPDLIQRHLISLPLEIYASQGYVEAHGAPQSLTEVQNHALVIFPPAAPLPFPHANWLYEAAHIDRANHPRLYEISNMVAIESAVKAGLGIALIPKLLMAGDDSGLVRLLPDLEVPSVDAYLCYAAEMRNSKRIAVLRDYLIDQLAEAKAQANM